MGISLIFNLTIGVGHDNEAGVWAGYCPALKIYSQGETEQEAITATQSAVSLFVVECMKRDVLKDVFKEHGLTKVDGSMEITKEDSDFIAIGSFDRYHEVAVPIRIGKEEQTCQPCA